MKRKENIPPESKQPSLENILPIFHAILQQDTVGKILAAESIRQIAASIQ